MCDQSEDWNQDHSWYTMLYEIMTEKLLYSMELNSAYLD